MRGLALIALGTAVGAGCAIDPHKHYRPTRMQVGLHARQYAVPGAAPSNAARAAVAQPGGGSDAETSGVTGALQFTQTLRRFLYVGGELEAGTLSRRGSNVAGGYGVLGLEHRAAYGTVGVELVGGYRALRAELGAEDIGSLVLEPRVRGQVWMSPQLSLGATAGTNVEDGTWMAGFFVGVHSEMFGAWKPRAR